ncbi:hypothetical protein LC613_05890 [Nostoc sphaeroides CHAB 2801]|uniref:hypothetical protein n=1 Tax=Nostoc sphaeroides TaxID=446679 RepID=UPI001C706149|nr:hypothetical protein [Nostoc sphaeroides]MCC5627701.1 hypothetical protein [Nostoc sphaeroides CHAB 2801]
MSFDLILAEIHKLLTCDWSIAIAPHFSSQLIQMFYIYTYQPHHPYTTSIL